MKDQVAVLGSLSLIVRAVSVDVKHIELNRRPRAVPPVKPQCMTPSRPLPSHRGTAAAWCSRHNGSTQMVTSIDFDNEPPQFIMCVFP